MHNSTSLHPKPPKMLAVAPIAAARPLSSRAAVARAPAAPVRAPLLACGAPCGIAARG
jgi:hypothetical protein